MITQLYLTKILDYDPDTGLFAWKISKRGIIPGRQPGGFNKDGYWSIQIDQVNYPAHRLAWLYMTGSWPNGDIDHKNLVRHDNRWDNLRIATRAQNMQNGSIRKDNTSGFRGVSWSIQKSKWRATIKINGVQKHLGFFDSAEAASLGYNEAAVKAFGNFYKE